MLLPRKSTFLTDGGKGCAASWKADIRTRMVRQAVRQVFIICVLLLYLLGRAKYKIDDGHRVWQAVGMVFKPSLVDNRYISPKCFDLLHKRIIIFFNRYGFIRIGANMQHGISAFYNCGGFVDRTSFKRHRGLLR